MGSETGIRAQGRSLRVLMAGVVVVVALLVLRERVGEERGDDHVSRAPELNPGVTLGEKPSATSGLEVVLFSETPSVCTVHGSSGDFWDISAIEEGTCTVLATQAGNAEYEAAEEQLSFPMTAPRVNLGKRQPMQWWAQRIPLAVWWKADYTACMCPCSPRPSARK